VLDNGVIRMTGLEFQVPGAAIRLNGTYALLTGALDFRGTATRLSATFTVRNAG
jgi:hypothetical protein